MSTVRTIERKRDGESLSEAEIREVVLGFATGSVPDYQMSALCMAITCKGMDDDEILALTRAMVESGEQIDFSHLSRPALDKHSTGGVGDKTSLVVAPLVAALGIALPKLSGRGLGHTGGTIDKLEAIPGFRTDLTIAQLGELAGRVGVAIASPTETLVPADRKMYALRDVTGTVPSMPLIVSSIMSKKLAVGTRGIVLDVKVGNGAFFATEKEARLFASKAIHVGEQFERPVRAVLSSMDFPLGRAVGNAIEVNEAYRALQGEGEPDLMAVVYALATALLLLAGKPEAEIRPLLDEAIATGNAKTTFEQWVEGQGGDVDAVRAGLPLSSRVVEIVAPQDGTLTGIGALAVGRFAMELGAGRATKADTIDPGAGIWFSARVGEKLTSGAPIASVYTSKSHADMSDGAIRDALLATMTWSDAAPYPIPNPVVATI